MPWFRRTITEQTGRELVDAIDHLSSCIADLVDVTNRAAAVQERVGGWTPPERHILAGPAPWPTEPITKEYRLSDPPSTAEAMLDLTSLRQHAENRTEPAAPADSDTPLIEREVCP